jgi:sarcosine oxidase subunit alpha
MDGRENFEITVNGSPITAYKGQTIAAAILASGLRVFRVTKGRKMRGPFCGIGICFDCRMRVNGISNVRTCMTLATPGCEIVSQDDALWKGKGE